MKYNDEEIRRQVIDELKRDPKVSDGVGIQVDVQDGIVTLSGTVDNFMDQKMAEVAARLVPSVKGVVQKIEVSAPAENRRTDEAITRDACQALLYNSEVPNDRVKVVVKDRWVSLEGELDWFFQKQEAEETVGRIRGVRGITNNVVVKTPVGSSDVKERIIRAFQTNALHRAGQINVEVQDGKCILSGDVRAWIEKTIAEQTARQIPGIMTVESKLVLSPLLEGKEIVREIH